MYKATDGKCCFNHIIGLPEKNNRLHPMYDYEHEMYDALMHSNNKLLWVKKATGLGVSEFMMRLIIWLCVVNNENVYKQICIVTGPRIDLAIGLIDRMKHMFDSAPPEIRFILNASNSTTIVVNNCNINAYPSHHLDSMRGLPNVKFILLDEADFFPIGQQQNARDVSERYIGKSNPYIVMVSTPNMPGGLYEQIEKEKDCIYRRLEFSYKRGVGKIYTQEEMNKAMKSPSFEREYNLKYGYGLGNVFNVETVDNILKLGQKYGIEDNNFNLINKNKFTIKSMGIDAGYGSSKFAIVITELVDGIINVVYAQAFERPDTSSMIDRIWRLVNLFQVHKVYVDGSNAAVVTDLKLLVGESTDWTTTDSKYSKLIIPVNFGTMHKPMLSKLKLIAEKGCLAVNESFTDLVLDIRVARANENALEKDQGNTMDLLDGLRLSVNHFDFTET